MFVITTDNLAYEKMKPTVSLVITTYNRKDALELVLISALQQSVPPNEIIVADDGSRADTRELILQYAQQAKIPIIHCWQEDTGFRLAAVRNLAIAKARYEYIVMIDGDIIMHKHFIKSHQKHAAADRFLQGSRVLMLKDLTEDALNNKTTRFSFLVRGVKSRLNALYLPWLSWLISRKIDDLTRTRGCNQSFWLTDLKKVNGFNEDFIGWGREDTEFMVRMLNSGKHCYKMKLEGFGFHLYHPESSKAMLPANQKILDDAIEHRVSRCTNGLDKHLNNETR